MSSGVKGDVNDHRQPTCAQWQTRFRKSQMYAEVKSGIRELGGHDARPIDRTEVTWSR